MLWLWSPGVWPLENKFTSSTNIILDSDYRDRLALKSTSDRTLGVGVYESEGTLLMLTASTMARVVVEVDKIGSFDYE